MVSFDKIELVKEGLRAEGFKTKDHRGQANLRTGAEQFKEKRFVRAIFNLEHLSPLGRIIDYEVPLKASEAAKHGDIDLLCLTSDAILCVEAKDPRGTTSILEAILEAFVYTSLIADRYDKLLEEFKLPMGLPLTPAILIGKSMSGQLQQCCKHSHLGTLVKRLNCELETHGGGRMRFFVVENDVRTFDSCLMSLQQLSGHPKIVFSDGFLPKVIEWSEAKSLLTENEPASESALSHLES